MNHRLLRQRACGFALVAGLFGLYGCSSGANTDLTEAEKASFKGGQMPADTHAKMAESIAKWRAAHPQTGPDPFGPGGTPVADKSVKAASPTPPGG